MELFLLFQIGTIGGTVAAPAKTHKPRSETDHSTYGGHRLYSRCLFKVGAVLRRISQVPLVRLKEKSEGWEVGLPVPLH